MKYLMFLIYLIRHKWFVFMECCRLGVPWRGITHDISKFLPGEFIAYANCFYATHYCPQQKINNKSQETYAMAWLVHQKRNRHHWQWWLLYGEENILSPMPMPDQYIKEMVADWWGAGMAQSKPDVIAWYRANRDKMLLHQTTRKKVELLLMQYRVHIGLPKPEKVMLVDRLHINVMQALE